MKNIKLHKYLYGYRLKAYISPLFKFFEAMFELVVPILLARLIDTGIKNGDTSYIISRCLLMVVMAFAGVVSTLFCQRFAAIASVGYGRQMRFALYRHINTLSYSELDKVSTAMLINNITIDTVNSQNSLGFFLRLVTRSPFLAIGSIVLAFSISPKLSLIFLSSVVLIGILIFLIMRLAIPRLVKVNAQTDKIARHVKENLVGNRVVRAFTHEQASAQKFEEENQKLKKSYLRVNFLLALGNPLCFLLVNLAVVLVVYIGGIEGAAGVSAGDLVALVNYLTQILIALLVIIQIAVIFSRSSASNRRIRTVFALQSEDLNLAGEKEFDLTKTAIEYRGVSFGYREDKNILENISFSLSRGNKLGITGSTGSGKSSLLSLLPRFYSERSGEILLFGKDINQYNIAFLRQKIKIAPSSPVLFSGTVRDNIRAGADISDEQILDALRTACAEDFAGDLDKEITAGGGNLSRGQKQRLGIARAIAASPEILILDDALSALDNVTTNAVASKIFDLFAQRTLLMVTRNPKILKECDLTLCLD